MEGRLSLQIVITDEQPVGSCVPPRSIQETEEARDPMEICERLCAPRDQDQSISRPAECVCLSAEGCCGSGHARKKGSRLISFPA